MKERLTGAIILVALIVLLVPEMLHGPIRPAPQARGSESAAEEPPLKSVTISLADDTHGGSAAQQPQTPAPVAPAAEPAATPQPPAAPASSPPAHTSPAAAVAAPAPQGAVASPGAPPATGAARSGGFVVQLGSFASRANAERLAKQVRGRGFQVSVSPWISHARSERGERLYRVLVGPAHDRAAAEELLTRLRATGHKGPIVPQ